MPLNIEAMIPDNDSVRLLGMVAESMDLSGLYETYSAYCRKPAVDPLCMFKVVSYAYMCSIYSTRKIMEACRRDINFMWLLGGAPAPSHSAISRFRSKRLGGLMAGLPCQLVMILSEIGEAEFGEVFVDGTKLEAAAGRYPFVCRKATERNEEKMRLKIADAAEKINSGHQTPFSAGKVAGGIKAMADFMESVMLEGGITPAHGKGRRKSGAQKLHEALKGFQARQEGYDKKNSLFNGRNSYSKTDTDAAGMLC